MNNCIIEEATRRFGQVIETKGTVLLIKRDVRHRLNQDAAYMTIKAGMNENGIGFHDGHYDMDLGNATVSFYARSAAETENKHVMQAALPIRDWNNNLVQFPRLISEIVANVNIAKADWEALCDSMDLRKEDVLDLFNRADLEWESDKQYINQ